MFGYLPGPVTCCQKAGALYRAHFCGLGTGLHRDYGAWARWLVNRDSTFLALLGSALTDVPPSFERTTCCNRFASPRDLLGDSPVLRYVAAVTICGLSAKLDDDALDERGWRGLAARCGSRMIATPISEALGLLHHLRFPVSQVRAWMAGQNGIETRSRDLHACSQPTMTAYGEVVGHLAVVCGVPQVRPVLRELGQSLGFLVYAHDAWDDWERDRRRGQFNPLHPFPIITGRREALLPALEAALQSLGSTFQQIPLRRNRDLLQSVLVEGAEQRVMQVAGSGRDKATRRQHPQSPLERTERRRDRCCDRCDLCNCDCSGCCDVFRCCKPGRGGGSMCDCNPCDGDGIECCGCDCS